MSNYSLKNVLKLKSKIEEQRLDMMTKSLNRFQESLKVITVIEVELNQTLKKIEKQPSINVINEKFMHNYIEKIRNELEKQKNNSIAEELIYEDHRNEYLVAYKNRKIIEKHKENYFEDLKNIGRTLEGNINNELATLSFIRKNNQI